jgi:hypothetical protein
MSKVQVPPLSLQSAQVPVEVPGTQMFEQQSALVVQGPPFWPQQVPLTHVWPLEQPGAQVPPQVSSPQVLFEHCGVQHPPPTHTWPAAHLETQLPLFGSHVRHSLGLQAAARQTEPHTLAAAQHVPLIQAPSQQLLSAVQELPVAEQTHLPLEQIPEQQSLFCVHPKSLLAIQVTQVEVLVSQTSPMQQSLVLSQPESPLGIHATHVPVELSQLFEQQSESLVQEPSFAIQHVPLLQTWFPEHVDTQAPTPSHSKHWLASHGAARQVEPQTFAGAQHV